MRPAHAPAWSQASWNLLTAPTYPSDYRQIDKSLSGRRRFPTFKARPLWGAQGRWGPGDGLCWGQNLLPLRSSEAGGSKESPAAGLLPAEQKRSHAGSARLMCPRGDLGPRAGRQAPPRPRWLGPTRWPFPPCCQRDLIPHTGLERETVLRCHGPGRRPQPGFRGPRGEEPASRLWERLSPPMAEVVTRVPKSAPVPCPRRAAGLFVWDCVD